jgi:hypothetical protein
MINQAVVLQEIDQIRKERRMSISDMIEGITSDRSYRRYLKMELPIPLVTLYQLIHRV